MARVKKGAASPKQPQTPSPQPGQQQAGGSRDVASGDTQSVTQSMNNMRVAGRFPSGQLAAKLEPGKVGRGVRLRTNFFKLTLNKDISLWHYELSFFDDKKAKGGHGGERMELPTRGMRMAAFKQMVNGFKGQGQDFHSRRLVFDGRKNMFSMNQALMKRQNVLRFECEVEPNEVRSVTAEYKLALVSGTQEPHVLDLMDKSQQSVQGLDIALSYPLGQKKVQRGVRFFDVEGESLGMNLSLLMGFKQSVRPCDGGYFVNVDRAAGLFQLGGRLPEIFCDILNFLKPRNVPDFVVSNFRMNDSLRHKLEQELKGFKVKVVIPGAKYTRTKKIAGFSVLSVSQITFFWQEKDQDVTVFDYYKERYGHALKFPNLPCVRFGNDNIPIEVCYLAPGQYYDKKMEASIQAMVTDRTIQPPATRFRAIQDSVAELRQTVRQTIDVQIASQGQEVMGRVLPPPAIQSGGGVIQVQDRPMRGNPCDYNVQVFASTRPIDSWCIVQLTRGPPAKEVHPFLKTFGKNLSMTANRKGWKLSANFVTRTLQYSGRQGMATFMSGAKEKGKMQLLLFAMPIVDDMYNDIKSCSNEIGIVAQCLNFNVVNDADMNTNNKRSQISKMGSMFVENMLKKMNAKVGGTKSVVADKSVPAFLKDKNVMFVGMDVYHPPAFTQDVQSLVGIVASYDKDFTQYFHQAMSQPQVDPENKKRVEEIKEAVFIVLKDFFQRYKKKNNGKFPDHVIVMRDGVSEGQFLHVRNMEVQQILNAMSSLGFDAKITFLTVQKRHGFRMFVEYKDEKGRDSVKNPEPGTVVDTTIVHQDRNEYYLNSHHALKGTSKPSHYTLIHNEANLSNDQIQGMSYVLSYLSARCDKPISLPVPVHYAHLVAERAAKLLESGRRNCPANQVQDQAWVNSVIRIQDAMIDRLEYV